MLYINLRIRFQLFLQLEILKNKKEIINKLKKNETIELQPLIHLIKKLVEMKLMDSQYDYGHHIEILKRILVDLFGVINI